MAVSTAPLDRILFEVISAFATCGLSVGLSAELEPFGKYVLSLLMGSADDGAFLGEGVEQVPLP
jgi:Trk-type K+ transport system membrane component